MGELTDRLLGIFRRRREAFEINVFFPDRGYALANRGDGRDEFSRRVQSMKWKRGELIRERSSQPWAWRQ